MKIKKIIDNTELKHTWDIEVDNTHEYVLGNGVISHNTSSDAFGATSGIDLIRDFVQVKNSKTGPFNLVVPNYLKGSSYYTLTSEVDNLKYLEMISKFQLYIDQSISTNTWFDEKDLDDDGTMSMKKIIDILKTAHKLGLKSLYYMNYDTSDSQPKDDDCAGGACKV